MYHDVCPGDPFRPGIPRHASMYHTRQDRFREQLSAIKDAGIRTCRVKEYLEGLGNDSGDTMVITFDDGWAGSLTQGVQCLTDEGMRATYFITRDFIGQTHYADKSMLVQAHKSGMELGIHGTTHRLLSTCSKSEVQMEFDDCRKFLEDLTGASVTSASMPGGDWSRSIADIARESGLASLSTSQPGVNRRETCLYGLHRMPIRHWMTSEIIERYCRFKVGQEVLRDRIFQAPKRVLGIALYTRLRRSLLGPPKGG
jgi:hypothetical protein